jgi:[protein-PII] uridylyltransferase
MPGRWDRSSSGACFPGTTSPRPAPPATSSARPPLRSPRLGRKEDRLTFELQTSLAQELGYRTGPRGRGRRALHASRLPGGGHAARGERCAAGPRRGGADAAAHLPARAQGGPLQGVPGTASPSTTGSSSGGAPRRWCRMFSSPVELGVPLYSWARERIARRCPRWWTRAGPPRWSRPLRHSSPHPAGRGAVLEEMHALGVLGALVPEFGRITAHHQNDLYHVYTVDVHTAARAPAPLCPARRRPRGRRARARAG